MTETLQAIQQHRRSLVLHTTASAACYVGFLATSAVSAVRALRLQHPVTLAALGLIVGAFLLLPRNYVPPVLVHKARAPEEELELDALRRLQRNGLYIRAAYLGGALVTLLLIPLLIRSGAH